MNQASELRSSDADSLLVDRVRINWNHLVNDVSEWSEVLQKAFPESEHYATH